ncbi:hypothetical protein HAZT_HAZT006979 [Hyalella azteca]|uniref:Slowpoke-binding protein n=1 Tax=Hyalella azteca TaxID=294128 RepID=A0A6A0H7J0_HYAAZ|nr:hypothetical protein HAZT_HAZT006979 [Hyalella azteca]
MKNFRIRENSIEIHYIFVENVRYLRCFHFLVNSVYPDTIYSLSRGACSNFQGILRRGSFLNYNLAPHCAGMAVGMRTPPWTTTAGSRIDKNWFSVRDTIVKTERLMTLQPHDPIAPVPILPGTREALIELFQALQHPYIYPVLDLDFATVSSHSYIVIIQPTNPKGTLKDLIYRSHWQQDWAEKYHQRASGLPLKQVQRLGRQILEALLFLQDRGFPPCGHIHSGNIVLQNGVARLSGLENTLFGFTSRIFPIIKKRLRENRDAIDSLCFGKNNIDTEHMHKIRFYV